MVSTEQTYKYHMQVQEDNSNKPKDVKAKTNLFKNSEPISPTTKTAKEIRTELSNEVNPTSKTAPEQVNHVSLKSFKFYFFVSQ